MVHTGCSLGATPAWLQPDGPQVCAWPAHRLGRCSFAGVAFVGCERAVLGCSVHIGARQQEWLLGHGLAAQTLQPTAAAARVHDLQAMQQAFKG